MKKLMKSFCYAFRGIGHMAARERNFRIHCCAAVTVLLLSRFYSFGKTEWALLFLQIAMVLAAECLNTAVEQTDNAITEEQSRKIRNAKDAAAAGVLFTAFSAVAIGFLLFWNPAVFRQIASWFCCWERWAWLAVYVGGWAILIFCKETYKKD